jgi:membrane associated rhomboid family serine protease
VRAMVLPLRDLNPTKRLPIITLLIIAVNVFVYFAIQPHSTTQKSNQFVYDHAVIPCELRHGHPLTVPQIALNSCSAPDRAVVIDVDGVPERAPAQPFAPAKNVYLAIIASMFLHANLLHIAGNMLFLWIFGNNVEDRLGRVRFTLFYFAAGIVSALGFTLANLGSVAPLLGASGAIAGVMGAYLVFFPRARILSLVVIIPIYLPAAPVLVVWFVTQFFTDPNSGVAWVAHVCGFIFGALVALAVRRSNGGVTRRYPPPPPLPPPFPPPPPLPGAWPGGLRGLE